MEARAAELEATLAALEREDGRGSGGVYAYKPKHGRRWYFKYRHADGSSSSKRGFTSRRAAPRARQALAKGVRRGEVKASRETFAEFWTRFLAAKKPYVTRGTLVDYEIHGRLRLLPAFGTRKLTAIERADVRAWLADMAEVVDAGDLGPKTINNALSVLSVCMGMAADDGLIAANPCLRVKHLPVAAREMDFLRLGEIPRYLDACRRTTGRSPASCSALGAASPKRSPCAGGCGTAADAPRECSVAWGCDRELDASVCSRWFSAEEIGEPVSLTGGPAACRQAPRSQAPSARTFRTRVRARRAD